MGEKKGPKPQTVESLTREAAYYLEDAASLMDEIRAYEAGIADIRLDLGEAVLAARRHGVGTRLIEEALRLEKTRVRSIIDQAEARQRG